MSAIRPNAAQFQQLAMAPDDGPVTMLNLLKFKQRAGLERTVLIACKQISGRRP